MLVTVLMQQGHFSSRRVKFSLQELGDYGMLLSLSLEDSRHQTASSPTVELIFSAALHSTFLKQE